MNSIRIVIIQNFLEFRDTMRGNNNHPDTVHKTLQKTWNAIPWGLRELSIYTRITILKTTHEILHFREQFSHK